MSLPKFAYFVPATIEEACRLLRQHNGRAKIIAGGTDLIVSMRERLIAAEYLVDITRIPGLDSIGHDAHSGLNIGALCTHGQIESSRLIRQRFAVLAQAAHTIGAVQVRNLGTIGGNLCHAAPSADSAPALLALDARARTFSLQGGRILGLEDFFTGPGGTALKPDEILTAIEVPNPPAGYAGIYLKHSPRQAMDLAVVGVAVVLCLAEDGLTCSDARIALGAVAPTPIRARQAEGLLRGKKLDDDVIKESARAAAEAARPISDIRGSAEYRKEIVAVLTGRGIEQAMREARQKVRRKGKS
ncbi:MAG: xanthine dehydrogenase family protein subunit M [Chloroflexi bacterium]|nr:xanthine dehydrogenase family protein subunit M [Chloroflexota bacterium]